MIVAPRTRIDRVSANDATTLATDSGRVPMNIGAILILEGASDLDFSTVRDVLESRLPRVPRLRQRLLKTPVGCGRPVWVDDPDFDLGRHLQTAPTATGQLDDLRGRGDDHRSLQIAAELVCRPLPRDQPLWRAC